LGLAFAPQVKFVKKSKGQAESRTANRVAASTPRDKFDDKTEAASESDAETSDDSTSDDEQETGKQRKHEMTVAGFKTNLSEYGNEGDDDDDDDDDDDLLLKKTGRSDKLLELQDSNNKTAVVDPAKSQVLVIMFIISIMVS